MGDEGKEVGDVGGEKGNKKGCSGKVDRRQRERSVG